MSPSPRLKTQTKTPKQFPTKSARQLRQVTKIFPKQEYKKIKVKIQICLFLKCFGNLLEKNCSYPENTKNKKLIKLFFIFNILDFINKDCPRPQNLSQNLPPKSLPPEIFLQKYSPQNLLPPKILFPQMPSPNRQNRKFNLFNF